jgi:hypothetical protein
MGPWFDTAPLDVLYYEEQSGRMPWWTRPTRRGYSAGAIMDVNSGIPDFESARMTP